MDTLSGKVAVITGAASGIGRASALALARRGTSVLVADINEEGARSAAAEIESNAARLLRSNAMSRTMLPSRYSRPLSSTTTDASTS
jgi:NAD(P)-dependent dehydrogenase (short-subunit alcohol dehydrogenase family)